MDLGTPLVEGDPDVVDSRHPEPTAEPSDVGSFAGPDRVDGVATGADRPHLHGNATPVICHEQIDLAPGDLEIPTLEPETLAGQPTQGQILPGGTEGDPASAQSLSSVFSSFSTLTSRKVSTCTFSRNRAGRNMSQTQASRITTSK